MRQHIIKLALLLLFLYAPALFAEPPVSPNGGDSSLEKPSPEGEGWSRGDQNKEKAYFNPPHPDLLPQGEGVKAVEVLRDPTVISEKMEQGLKSLTSPTLKNALTPSGGGATDGKLTDPTLMNQNFRDALNRKAGKAGSGTGPAAVAATALPKITLLASICGGQNNTNSAILGINGKAQMVRAGDKFSVIDNSRVMEVQVIEIHAHYVKIIVPYSIEPLILQ